MSNTSIPTNGSAVAEFEQVNLIDGTFPVTTVKRTILAGQNLARFTLMGVVTASGKLKAVDADSGDGSQNPRYILLNNTDTATPSADKVGEVYAFGRFNKSKIVLVDTDDQIDSFVEALANNGIFLVDWVPN